MTRRPPPPILAWGGWVLVMILAAAAGGIWPEPGALSGSASRAMELVSALARPDLSLDTLAWAGWLGVETVAVAAWGTALGAAAGFGLALLASERITHADARPRSWATRLRLGASRSVLDVLRAIPDFAWALVVLVVLGPGPLTGMLALALGVTGILGRIYSQLLDEVDPSAPRVVALCGAPRLVVALWGHVPPAAGSMLSYTLVRFECSLRNASVIGIVGGGGLGAALFEELGFGRFDRVSTVLLTLLVLTGVGDRLSKAVMGALRRGTLTRRRVVAGVSVGLLACAGVLAPAAPSAALELGRLDGAFISATLAGLATPNLAPTFLLELLADAVMPLAVAVLATGLAAFAAWGVLLLAPRRPLDPGAPAMARLAFAGLRHGIDALALVTRAIPDVVWLLLLGAALRMGALAALGAIAVHSFGVLMRLWVEAVDDAPAAAWEVGRHGTARAAFTWSVWPRVSPVAWTHLFLQAESNVRAGLIVGIVGAGGLGDAFHDSITFWRLSDASMQALMMIVLTLVVDRAARALGARRSRRLGAAAG